MKKRTKAKLGGVLVLVALVAICANPSCNFDSYNVTVTDKQIKRTDGKDIYLVFTVLDNGKPRVFKNVDQKLFLKFNSSDLNAILRVNRRYRIKTVGWRWTLKSWYENILKVEPLEADSTSAQPTTGT